MLRVHQVADPPLLHIGGHLMQLTKLSSSHSINMVGLTALEAQQSHPIHLHSPHSGEGSSFPGLVPSNETVNSECEVGVKLNDSGVVIGYQVISYPN